MPVNKPRFVISSALSIAIILMISHVQAAKVQLAWDAPTRDTDGTPVTDLAGYTLYYWQPDWDSPASVDVGNQTTYTLADLEAGQTYHFAVTASNTADEESVFSNEVSATIPSPPVADFGASPLIGPAPLTVSFTDTSTGSISTRRWDFDDGATSTTQHPVHTYTAVGTYTVSLTVTGAGNSAPVTVSQVITVTSPDTDGDGLPDLDERDLYGTDPTRADTDADGYPDGAEVAAGTDPRDPTSPPPAAPWSDYRVTVTLWSDDNDALGVMFRYQDADNYYRFSWDRERAYRRLVKREHGTFTLLAEDAVPYVSGQAYQLEIVAQGARLEVWIDGQQIFAVTDSSFARGPIALYSWGNQGSHFADVWVEALPTGTVLLAEEFGSDALPGWSLVDEGRTTGPSAWATASNTLVQDSNIHSAPLDRAALAKLGTFALYTLDSSGW